MTYDYYPKNVNFDKLFADVKNNLSNKPKLLLHVCCAPCATHCLTQVLDAFDVTLFYSNDNITSQAEWQKRLDELYKLVDIVNDGKFAVENDKILPPSTTLKLVVAPFAPQTFLDCAKGLESCPEGGERCQKCFELRLVKTRDYAEKHAFDYFGTTLTVSPYKNCRLINEIGRSLQKQVVWLPSDFKKHNGYANSISLSHRFGLYRQHYCGCPYSLVEQ